MYVARILFGFVAVALLSQIAHSAPKATEVQSDSVEKVTRELYVLASRYRATPSPSDRQVEQWRTELEKLSGRTMRLPDWQSEPAQELYTNIRTFQDLLPKPRPEGLWLISTPQAGEGGHTAQGVAFLKEQIDRFGTEYRRIKGQDSVAGRSVDWYIEHSRDVLNQAVETSLEVASEQLATNSHDPNTIHIAQGGGVSYQSYSPQENLQWAYDVATLGIRFESRVGGKPAPWRSWQGKLRGVAAKHGFTLIDHIR